MLKPHNVPALIAIVCGQRQRDQEIKWNILTQKKMVIGQCVPAWESVPTLWRPPFTTHLTASVATLKETTANGQEGKDDFRKVLGEAVMEEKEVAN